MEPLSGQISDRLRRMFGRNDPAWNPNTNRTSTPKRHKLPKGVDGQSLSGRKKSKKK